MWYQSIQAFGYDSVVIRANINNTQELFVYDEKGNFIEIATAIGFNGVSAETAKRAETISLKRIKEAKKEMEAAKKEQHAGLQSLIEKAAINAPRTITPTMPKINNIDIESARLKSEARMLAASGDDAMLRDMQIKEEHNKSIGKKRDLSYFAAITKRKEE